MKIKKYFKNILLYITIFLTLIGCSVRFINQKDYLDNDNNEDYQIIEISNLSFTLEWDPPEDSLLIDSYNIYYKSHNLDQWILLDTISSNDSLNREVHYNDLTSDNTNEHDFGVSAVYNSDESLIHSSLSVSAIPTSGWYVKWIF